MPTNSAAAAATDLISNPVSGSDPLRRIRCYRCDAVAPSNRRHAPPERSQSRRSLLQRGQAASAPSARSDLGFINPALYKVANDPARYASDFFDVTVGNNQTTSIPGYGASQGWDAVTGLGTPNAANLIPDLIAASH